jgi:tRNA pseudouridine38-40 synthase
LNYFTSSNTEESHEKLLIKINEYCQKFVGTHNFHNYSKNLKAKDPKARRYVISFNCKKIDNNWRIFTIVGQSFVYHQIRRIIGCLVQTIISDYESNFIDNTFFNNHLIIPLAPPLGLYLRSLSFESYNLRQ